MNTEHTEPDKESGIERPSKPTVTAHQTPTGGLLLNEENTPGWISTDTPMEARQ